MIYTKEVSVPTRRWSCYWGRQ